MELEERAEEVLETLWIYTEERQGDSLALDDLGKTGKESVEPLLKSGYIVRADRRLKLTDEGRLIARNVVRRHRLSERLYQAAGKRSWDSRNPSHDLSRGSL